MSKELLDRRSGISTLHHYDDTEKKTTIEQVQDVEPTLKANRIERTENPKGYTKSKEYKKIASIPPVVFNQWLKENPNLMRDEKDLKRRLNDPDNRFLRTSEGHF